MNFDVIKDVVVPIKISPCPIKEALVELRFDSNLPASDMIAGILYTNFKNIFQTAQNLPAHNIPIQIREMNENFKYASTHELVADEFILRIGQRSIVLCYKKEYKGWDLFFNFISQIFDGVSSTDIIKEPLRLGLRYISFFENSNIFEKLKLKLNFQNNDLSSNRNAIRTEFDLSQHPFTSVIQIANNATLASPGLNTKGSSIDIDVFTNQAINSIEEAKGLIKDAHDIEKKIFFSILDKEFLDSLNPEYENGKK